MTFPIEIGIGSFHFPLHTLLESLGIFIGFRYFLYLRKNSGDVIEQQNRIIVIIAALFGAVIGSRLIGSLENPPAWYHSAHPMLYFYQNKTVLGGFLGGLFAVEGIKKIIAERQASGDLFVFPLLLALIIGRIGCFSMGVYEETYGTLTHSWSGMNLGDGQLRHPVALYEIAFLIVFWILLHQLKKKLNPVNGALFKLFMIGYLLFRLMLDFIKPHVAIAWGLSTIQLTAISGLCYYYPYIVKPKKLFYA